MPTLRQWLVLGGMTASVAAISLPLWIRASAGGMAAFLPTKSTDSPQNSHLTSEQDHRRLLDLLRITALRPGPSGDPKSPDAANVDEARVVSYRLPDPL